MQPKPSATLRLAEIIDTLSLATDLGMGQPLEFALTGCVLATRMGESLGLPISDLRDVYYFGLLRFIGCNSDTYHRRAVFGVGHRGSGRLRAYRNFSCNQRK